MAFSNCQPVEQFALKSIWRQWWSLKAELQRASNTSFDTTLDLLEKKVVLKLKRKVSLLLPSFFFTGLWFLSQAQFVRPLTH